MSDLSALHYLGIYQTRLSMAERGVTSPKPEVVAFMRRLVAALSALSPTAAIRLEAQGDHARHHARFIAAATGDLLGEFTFTHDA